MVQIPESRDQSPDGAAAVKERWMVDGQWTVATKRECESEYDG